jgi:hypothetical protein
MIKHYIIVKSIYSAFGSYKIIGDINNHKIENFESIVFKDIDYNMISLNNENNIMEVKFVINDLIGYNIETNWYSKYIQSDTIILCEEKTFTFTKGTSIYINNCKIILNDDVVVKNIINNNDYINNNKRNFSIFPYWVCVLIFSIFLSSIFF